MMLRIFILLLSFPLVSNATNYYCTQSGAGTHSGLSLGNAFSVADLAGDFSSPHIGDTVFVSGAITSAFKCFWFGNATTPLIIDASAAQIAAPNTDYAVALNGTTSFLMGGTFSGGSGNLKTHNTGGTITVPAVCGTPPYDHLIQFPVSADHCTIDGVTLVGNGTDNLGNIAVARGATNLVVQNCYSIGAQGLLYVDTTSTDTILIKNNWCVTVPNVVYETDILHLGDAYNVTIEGNYFKMGTPGGNANGRHNDCIQSYVAGGGRNGSGWIIRYNWIELNAQYGATLTAGSFVVGNRYTIVSSGSTSFTAIGAANNSPGTIFDATGVGSGTGTAKDTADGNQSWGQLESLSDNGAIPAAKVYGNVFKGNSGQQGQGMPVYNGNNSTVYWYNNTAVSVDGSPDNTMRFLVGSGYSNLYMRNNIGFDATGTAGTSIFSSFTAGAAWGYNYFFNWGSPSSTYYGTGTGATNTDPLLTNPSSQNFSLQSGSPCKFTGDSTIGSEFNQGLAASTTWPGPSKITRAGGAWSIGAYEFAGGASSYSSSLGGKVLLSGKVQIK